jgi:Mn2+/Fe2+ NRAMP family transporter
MTFATIDIRPIPAIILAQALNGIILPVICFILVYLIHDPLITGRRNSPANSILLGVTLVITVIIGLNNLILAVVRTLDVTIHRPGLAIFIYATISVVITSFFFRFLLVRKRGRE